MSISRTAPSKQRVINFAATTPPRRRCSFCYRQSQGAFIRRGASTLYACHDHYPNGMVKLVEHYRRSRGGGG